MSSERLRRAAFLDRDGVLVEILRDAELGVLFTAFHPDQLRLTPQAGEALRQLGELGYLRLLISNQPGPAKGHFTLAQLDRTHERLVALLQPSGAGLEGIYVCPHHPEGAPGGDPALIQSCECRKPKPGMLLRAANEHGIDLAQSVFIGDSPDDVRAGQAAGCRTVLINGGRCELCPNTPSGAPHSDATVRNLPEAVAWIAANLQR